MDIGMILACAALGASGCNILSKGCTLVGCEDSFTANVRRADSSFPAGAHRIEVLADSAIRTCTFTYPFAMPGDNPNCGLDLRVMVWPETTCTDTTDGGVVTHQCDTIPTRLYELITIPGTPGQVHVSQSVDDTTILDVAAAPSYQDVAPNGRECGPICRQATASWTFMN
jgi:hypothetical protein